MGSIRSVGKHQTTGVDIFQELHRKFLYNMSMPKKKKNSFDNRDALEILRDAFWSAKTPAVAELGTRAVKTRVAAFDKYREQITPEDLLNQRKEPGKKRQADKAKKRDPYKLDDPAEKMGELPTFWSEQPEPELTAQAEKNAPTDLKAEKSLPERQTAIEQQREQLSPKEHAQFDAILENAKQQMQGEMHSQEKTETKPALPLEITQSETPPSAPLIEIPPAPEPMPAKIAPPLFMSEPSTPKPDSTPEDIARVEQYKQLLVEKEMEHYQSKHGENAVAEMEKHVRYLKENKTKNDETDTEAVDRLQRAIEIAKARVPVAMPLEPVPELITPMPSMETAPITVPTFDLGTSKPEEFEKPEKKEEGETPKTESRFEERIIELEKHINEMGGTPKERQEHWALQKAKEHHYSVSEINARIDELKKEPAGMHAIEMKTLADARDLVAAETGEISATQATAPEIVAAEITAKVTPAEAPKTVEKQKQKEIPLPVIESFKKLFPNIEVKDLQNIEGFSRLTEGQQFLVLDNFYNLTLGRIQKEAVTPDERPRNPDAQFLARVWEGIWKNIQSMPKNINREYRREKGTAGTLLNAGINEHEQLLRFLTQEMDPNLDVTRTKDGSLEIAYVNEQAFESLLQQVPKQKREQCRKAIQSYNRAASNFRELPVAWSSDLATRAQRKAFEKSEKTCHNAQQQLLAFAGTYGSPSEQAKLSLLLLGAQERLETDQFLRVHPDAETYLKTVISSSAWGRYAKEAIRERGVYLITGGIARTATVAIMGAASLPVTATAMAGVMATRGLMRGRMSVRKTRETLQKEARAAREGSAPDTKKPRDYTSVQAFNTGFEKIIKKLTAVDARDNTAPLTLAERQERTYALRQLENILHLAQEYKRADLLRYGEQGTMLAERFRLARNIGMAHAQLAKAGLEGFAPKTKDDIKVEQNIEKTFNARESRVSDEHKKRIRKEALVQGTINAVYGGSGVWLSGYFDMGEKFQKILAKTVAKTGTLSGINFDYYMKEYGPKRLPEVMRDAKFAAARTEGIASVAETELAARRTETAIRFGKGGKMPETPPPENLPIAPEKSIDPSRFKTSHPIDMESSRPLSIDAKELREAMEKRNGEGAKLAEAALSALESNAEYTKLAKIKKGEGMWHAVRRQLNYQMSHTSPEEFAKRYGLSVEDIKLHPKNSIEHITVNLLTDQDYIKPKGTGGVWVETRLKPGANVLLSEEGKIEITDKDKFTYEWQTPSARREVLTEIRNTPDMIDAEKAGSPSVTPEKAFTTPAVSERLLSQPENIARKISGLNLDTYADVRDTPLAKFLKEPPRGKGFRELVEVLRRAKPSEADMRQSVSEFLTKRFSG